MPKKRKNRKTRTHQTQPPVRRPHRRDRPDPTGSIGGNIIEAARSQGFDVTGPAGVAAAMEWFNSLSYEERFAVTETGRLPDDAAPGTPQAPGEAGAAFGLGPGGRPRLSVVPDLGVSWSDDDAWPDEDDEDWPDEDDDVELADIWPPFLGDPVDPDAVPAPTSLAEQAAAVSGTTLVRRADALLAWLGDGRRVTSTGALRQADTAEVIGLLGLDDPHVRSMWDVPELALLWTALVAGGFIDLSRTTVSPAAKALPWVGPNGDAEARVNCGNVLFGSALLTFLAEQEDGTTVAAMPPLTFLALTKAAQPGGVHLAAPTHPSADLMAVMVHADLAALATAGVLSVADDRYELPAHLLPVLDVVMQQVVDQLGLT
ncbi:hypothetical protein [Georgenia muralis]|uniref:hypothetical protein n=1 Tax=Georgenia muralis TaxID=154117 RepID=UPI000F50C76C|nr:hypothetical protein [Georgenia muralis]